MVQFEVFDSGVEVHGRTILSVVDGALARFSDEYQARAREALAENGVSDPEPDEWYPQEAWLNSFAVIAEDLQPHLLDRLGGQIPAVVEWPNDVSGVAEGLRSIDSAYRLNHRGGDIGYYRFESTSDNSGEMICRNPYPCYFDRGLIRAVAQKHAPIESFVFIEETGDRCRRDGDDTCTYAVYW